MSKEYDPNLSVVILAAGQGKRMLSETPKALTLLGGITLIEHVLRQVRRLGPDRIVVVLGDNRSRVEPVIRTLAPEVIVAEQGPTSGTAAALEAGVAKLPETGRVLVLCADTPLAPRRVLAGLLGRHRQEYPAVSVLTVTVENPASYGRILRDQNDLIAIVEESEASHSQVKIQEVNSGVYVFELTGLSAALSRIADANAQSERYLTSAIELLVKNGRRVQAFRAEDLGLEDSGLLMGINDKRQLAEAARRLNACITGRWQDLGVYIPNPLEVWIDVDAVLETDVTVLPGSFILGKSRISAGALIGPHSTILESRVHSGARIIRSEVRQSEVGEGVRVGPFAYIRPGTFLGDFSKAGSFVEIKNSQIGAGSKVPHLSYVGDVRVGPGCNFGAGTIFANYDGIEKHLSVVGRGTYLGAGTIVVSPICIGDRVYTGANSTVRRDIPSESLRLSVSEEKDLPGWVSKNRPESKDGFG